jgi:hypothetical protein
MITETEAHKEAATPKAALDRELAKQNGDSERKKGPFGTFWRKVGASALTSLGLNVAGNEIIRSQETITTTKTPDISSATVTLHEGVLANVGEALAIAGSLGLLATAAVAGYGLIRDRRLRREGKKN